MDDIHFDHRASPDPAACHHEGHAPAAGTRVLLPLTKARCHQVI